MFSILINVGFRLFLLLCIYHLVVALSPYWLKWIVLKFINLGAGVARFTLNQTKTLSHKLYEYILVSNKLSNKNKYSKEKINVVGGTNDIESKHDNCLDFEYHKIAKEYRNLKSSSRKEKLEIKRKD